MTTYVISDLHGCNRIFNQFLESINLQETDILYIVGDILDRGVDPAGIYETVKSQPNIVMTKGNHELMFANFYRERYLNHSIDRFNKLTYFANGGGTTIDSIKNFCEAHDLDEATYTREFYDFVMNLPDYLEITVAGQKYILVHAGITGKSRIEDEDEEDLLWVRHQFFDLDIPGDVTYIFGHTPTLLLNHDKNMNPWFAKNKIGIDGGLALGEEKGQLNVLNLDAQEIIVVKLNQPNRIMKFKKSG